MFFKWQLISNANFKQVNKYKKEKPHTNCLSVQFLTKCIVAVTSLTDGDGVERKTRQEKKKRLLLKGKTAQ